MKVKTVVEISDIPLDYRRFQLAQATQLKKTDKGSSSQHETQQLRVHANQRE